MCYIIQVTNYGQSINDILSFANEAFIDFIGINFISRNVMVATVYNRNEYHNCHEVLHLCRMKKRLSLIKGANAEGFINFQHYKRYLSFQLKVC